MVADNQVDELDQIIKNKRKTVPNNSEHPQPAKASTLA